MKTAHSPDLEKTRGLGIIVLSGEPSTIPNAELNALVEICGQRSSIQQLHPRVSLVRGDVDFAQIVRRGAYVQCAGRLLGFVSLSHPKTSLAELDFGAAFQSASSFAVRAVGIERTGDSQIVALLGDALLERLPWAKIDLRNPEAEILVLFYGEDAPVILSAARRPRRKWVDRRPRLKPFFHPSALYPKMARAMVNMARVRKGELLLDPFAGTGSILIEAEYVGARSVGLDASRKMCLGAVRNIHSFTPACLGVCCGTALSLPFSSVDGIATDPPYGREASTRGVEPNKLLGGFLYESLEVLRRGGRCVVLHSREMELPEVSELKLVEEHQIPVHRSLTRVLSVLERR